MNVSTTALPRRSVSDSRRSTCAVSVKAAAGPIVGNASGFGAADAAPDSSAAITPRTRALRITLTFQLLLQLVEEPPVGALGEDLLRARLDHARFVQPEGIEPRGVLRVELSPLVVRQLLHRLQSVVVIISAVRHEPRRASGFERADVGRLQDRTKRAPGRHRVLADELAIRGDNAAEVLRPRSVDGAVDDDVTQLLGP